MKCSPGRTPMGPRPRSRAVSRAVLAGALLALAASACTPEAASQASPEGCRVLSTPLPLPEVVRESSGAAFSRRYPGIVWTHNDSGDESRLYALTAAGELAGSVRVTGARNRDWEDLALAPCGDTDCLWIADTGDNGKKRGHVDLVRVPEPAPGDEATRPAQVFRLRYPDGPHDAEALFALSSGELFLLTKGDDGPIALYRVPPGRTGELQRLRTLAPAAVPHARQVTGADASADGRWVAVRTYGSLFLYRTADLLAGRDSAALPVDLAALREVQGEAVAVGRDGKVVLTSEGKGKHVPATLSVLRCTPPGAVRRLAA